MLRNGEFAAGMVEDDDAPVSLGGVGGVVGEFIFMGVGGGRGIVRRDGVRFGDDEDIIL